MRSTDRTHKTGRRNGSARIRLGAGAGITDESSHSADPLPEGMIPMTSRLPLAIAATAGTCALALGVTAPALAADAANTDDKAMVSVFHGVPGLTVDVYANGDELLSDFKPGTVTTPSPLTRATTTSRSSKPARAPTAHRPSRRRSRYPLERTPPSPPISPPTASRS